MRADLQGLITAIRTLSILPVGGRDAERFSDSLVWFPVVGMMLGAVVCAAGFLWNHLVCADWPAGGAVVLLGSEIVLTRALHLDGLADWADALGGSTDPQRRLQIMKDPHVGPFGVVALVGVLLGKWVAWARLLSSGGLLLAVPVFVSSRAVMAYLMTRLPSARSGEGTAGRFLQEISPRQRWATHAVSLCLCLPFGLPGVILYGVGWLIAARMGASFRKGFGGITGDLLGTTNEMVEVVLLLICGSAGGLFRTYGGWGWGL